MSNHNDANDDDAALDTSLDTKTYPVDYVSELFNAIDWGSRVKTKRPTDHWIDPGSWDKHSYTMKYLEYRVEEGQIDLTNPFHIEESNKIRTRLEKKKSRGKKEVTELNMMTEGLKAVDDENTVGVEAEDEEDDDYFDEYGNIKDNTTSSDIAAKVKKDKDKEKINDPEKDPIKDGKIKEKRKPPQQKGNPGWKDLDSMSENTDNSGKKPKSRDYVKSAIDIQAANKIMFPRESSLSWPEQEKFLFNERLIREGRLGPSSGNQWTFYQNFKELVVEEQEEFARFIRDIYSPVPPTLCEGHRKYVTDHRTVRLRRPLSLPRYWNKTKEVRLVGVNPEQSCAMILEQTLLELGDKPRAKIPELIRNSKQVFTHQLPQQYLRLVNTIPPDPKVMPGSCSISRVSDPRSGDQSCWSAQSSVQVDNSKFYHKESCIDDHNVSLLAQHLVPDVIISSSALKCLFDNHKPGLARSWEIPFIVRTFKSDVDERRVVIFGKPLPQREVTDEDLTLLAHKVAVNVKLFQQSWELQPRTKPITEKRQSPGEDLFGDANVDIQDLEVFGTVSTTDNDKSKHESPKTQEAGDKTDASEDKMEIDIGVDDVLLQVDGGDDSDSEDDNLVISEKSESDKVSPPRRSSRLRQKSSSSNASNKTPSRPSETVNKPEEIPDQEILDYEPEEEPLGKSTSIDESSSESDCEDAPMAKSLFLEKLKMASNPDTSFNPPFESTQIDDTLQSQTRTVDIEGNESSSSSSDDDDAGQLLLQKKMSMIQSQAAVTVQATNTEHVQEDKYDSSSSESEDGGDLLKKKLMMTKGLEESSAQAENLGDKSDDDEGKMILKKKMMMVENQSWASASLSTVSTTVIPQTESIEDSSLVEKMDDQEEEVVSPKKKLRRLSSGSEDDEEEDPVKSKLKQLGRENVDVDKLKHKILAEKKLSSMKERMEEKSDLQAERRQTRARRRNAAKDSSKTNDKLFGSDSNEETSPKKSPLKKVKEESVVRSRRIPSKGDSSESETDEKGRFSKFASSGNSSSRSDFLGNLLTGQDKLLHSDQRRHYNTAPPPAQHDNSLDLGKPVIAPGLPPLDTFKPPIPGCNVTYRMWKLYDKQAGGGGKVLRCVVRSKVAGVTQAGVVVTPSVKMEHQPQFGAEQLTASQASRDWIMTLIRPHSMLTRVRLGQDSKIAMIEEKTLSHVTQECRSVGVDPAKQLVNVYNIFSELSSLSAGQYLLQHSNKTGAFCSVLAAAEDKSSTGLDLHKMYTTLQPEDSVHVKVPYTPIDVDILTPWHQVHGRVPGTFEPSGDKGRGGRGGRGRGGRGGNRGGGNRKRGK